MKNTETKPTAGPVSALGRATGSTIWLRMDFPASLRNMLLTLPLVIVTVVTTWDIAEVQFVTGLMAGLWVASAHNVAWGWLTRRANSPNKSRKLYS